MTVLDDIKLELDEAFDDLEPEHKELATEIALDLVSLHARQVQGEDVGAEIALAKSAAVAMVGVAKERLVSVFLRGVGRAARGILVGAGMPVF
jgi:hypothetical protein